MKKLFKKIAAIVMVAVIAVSAMVIPTTTASAAGVFDGAKKMEAMEYYNINLPKANEHEQYKITLSQSGDLTLRFRECSTDFDIVVYKSNAEIVYSNHFHDPWGNPLKNWETVIKDMDKGTYYVDFCCGLNWGNGDGYMSDFYYTFTPDLKPTISLKVTITKGTTLQLGSIVENYDGKVTWESTKKSVATVTSKGKVTAKKKGTTTIRAKLSDGTYVQIRVVVKNPATKNTTTTTK